MQIKTFRTRKKWTLKRMASFLGTSLVNVWQWENGVIPRQAMQEKIQRKTQNKVKANSRECWPGKSG